MRKLPTSFVHINFLPGEIFFDARRIWTVLNKAVADGKVSAATGHSIHNALGGPAIHIATRFLVLRFAVNELHVASETLYSFAPKARRVDTIPNAFSLSLSQSELSRDHVILAIDCFFFEFRAFLELIAKFAFEFLSLTGRKPSSKVYLSNGNMMLLVTKKGELKTHNFVLYLSDLLKLPSDWFTFLATQRNFFTHSATPYCAIETSGGLARPYDLLIMRKNIHDFSKANPTDFIRLSECMSVIGEVQRFSNALEEYLINALS